MTAIRAHPFIPDPGFVPDGIGRWGHCVQGLCCELPEGNRVHVLPPGEVVFHTWTRSQRQDQ